VERNDRERGRFVHDYCAADLKNPELYDLVCNQQRLGVEGITELILQAIAYRKKSRQQAMQAV